MEINRAMLQKANEVLVGDTVVIRRTNGAEQLARVHAVERDRCYMAPELVRFVVIFIEGGKEKVRGCNSFDLVSVVEMGVSN